MTASLADDGEGTPEVTFNDGTRTAADDLENVNERDFIVRRS
jgi:hypothetical protein